ncbi:MAG: DUF547 domain-containing protein [Saprospiraceae bacterium]|jgi:hypothetical protein|nr:DUF547 domain-containing protein [Saprospiraceae bacterium]
MKIIILNIFFSLFYGLNITADTYSIWKLNDSKDESKEIISNSNPFIIDTDHSILDKLLGKYVSVFGKVNYKGLKSDKALLDLYLSELQNGPGSKASKNEQLAFWINAYNAFTLKMIIDNYPVKSITTL